MVFSNRLLNAKLALSLWFTKAIKVGALISIWVIYNILQILFFVNLGGLLMNSLLTISFNFPVSILFSASFLIWLNTLNISPIPFLVLAEIGNTWIYFAKSIIAFVFAMSNFWCFTSNKSTLFTHNIIGKAWLFISWMSVISLCEIPSTPSTMNNIIGLIYFNISNVLSLAIFSIPWIFPFFLMPAVS